MPTHLFSYGTLQLEQVQLNSFGRKLNGHPDQLYGFRLQQLEIKDEKVLRASNQKFHPVAVLSDNPEDFVEGMVFEVTEEELKQADEYEVDDYKRVSAKLASGKKAWVYISAS